MTPEDVLTYKIDRTGWPAGPWDTEPDRVDFRACGYPCLLLRNALGAWCGYVGVPPGHPDYGRHYKDVEVSCHGDLTYGDAGDDAMICHVPAPGESDQIWWFGFECAHAFDVVPTSAIFGPKIVMFDGADAFGMAAEYRDLAYARREVGKLASQLFTRS